MKKGNLDNCDGAFWALSETETDGEIETNIDTTIYTYNDKITEPDDLGFKYHILTYKEDKSDAEVMSAYIGDVSYFIANRAKAGYNGLMVKNKSVPMKDIKKMFKKILKNWQFPIKVINSTIKQF